MGHKVLSAREIEDVYLTWRMLHREIIKHNFSHVFFIIHKDINTYQWLLDKYYEIFIQKKNLEKQKECMRIIYITRNMSQNIVLRNKFKKMSCRRIPFSAITKKSKICKKYQFQIVNECCIWHHNLDLEMANSSMRKLCMGLDSRRVKESFRFFWSGDLISWGLF